VNNGRIGDVIYKTRQWRKVRDYVWKRDKGLCQTCLKRGVINGADIVHHIIHIDKNNVTDESITLNPDNLVSLCRDCHAKEHSTGKRYVVDEMGFVREIS